VAFIFIVEVMVHIYLGTLANPGTLMGIFEGKVSRSWVKNTTPFGRQKIVEAIIHTAARRPWDE